MESINRSLHSLDWITLVLFISLVFLVISKSYFYGRFLNFLILPFNNKYIFMYSKKDRLLSGFQIFFTAFQVLNFALFIFLARKALWGVEPANNLLFYLYILFLLLAVLLVKIIVQLGNAFIFNNGRVVSDLIFKKLSYLNYSALVMVLANVILAYIFPNSNLVVYACILLVLVINIVGWITLIKNHQKLITTYFFYFILYLCALEIAPLVLIVNALTY